MESLRLDTLRPQELTWDRAVRMFLLRCRSKNVSPGTLYLYEKHLARFQAWAGPQGFNKPSDIGPNELRGYFQASKGRGLKDSTVDVSFRVLRTFFRFLVRDGLLLQDPMTKVERPKMESRQIRPFTPEELRSLLAQVPTKTTLGLRDFAITVLLADTALRVSEALNLSLEDVDLANGTVRVMGKGRKERIVPFGQTARRALLQWLQARGEIPGMRRVFVNCFGQPITLRTYARALADYGKAAGLNGVRVSPHTLRHFAALSYLRNGGDPLSLMKLLGHTDLAMTRRYVALTGDDLVAKHRQASPLDRMGVLPGERKQVRLK